jgi:HlyD family secretion protein
MDVPRKGASQKRMIRRAIFIVAGVALIGSVTLGVSRLKPAAQPVERGTSWIGSVKRGPMIRQVRGLGTLVPEEVLYVPAQTDGRVERIMVRPGTQVTPDTIIMVLSNQELELAALDAEWQVKAAEATYTDLRVKLETQALDLRANAAKVNSDYVQARLKSDLEQRLGKEGLTSELNLRITKATADELEHRNKIEAERVKISRESVEAQLAAQRVQIDKLRAAYELKRKQVEQLKIRAGTTGILQQLGSGQVGPNGAATQIEVGQRVALGTVLAKIAQPWKLKAELKIAETQAKDIMIGQKAEIDTRNGVIPGRVTRIDPAVVNGTRTIDVKLEGDLPAGAVPDLSVDGTVELERLADVVYIERPVYGQPNSTVGLFKLTPDGLEANRVQVRLGRSSVNHIEVVDGLKVGDQVILSDMSAHDSHDRVRLN